MPATEPLDALPLWVLALVFALASLLADEGGFRFGRRRARRTSREGDAAVGTIVSAELGLLAFLLAFSFGIVASRFDVRRQAVVNEANAIGTTFLRAELLPEPQRGTVRRLLRDYTDLRLVRTAASIDQIVQGSETIHGQLWREAVIAAAQNPQQIPTGLFIQALNDVIDMHATRLMATLHSRMPPPVWLVLFAAGLLSFFSMGYQAGLSHPTRSPAAVILAFTFGAVIWLVSDLDRPGEGFLHVNQQPMLDVRRLMGDP